MKNQNCFNCQLSEKCHMRYREIDTHHQRYNRIPGCPVDYIEKFELKEKEKENGFRSLCTHL